MTETPTAAAQAWLAGLDGALQRRDVDAALELFEDESYWRDFVAFTWNLKTLEGKADIRRMLRATLDHVQPANWTLAEDATGSAAPGGTVEAWITFETGAARGYGHLRLRNGKCWTLLTTMQELKGSRKRRARAANRAWRTKSSAAAAPGRNSRRSRKRGSATRSSPTA
jgi:putative flavoprotein involved in K+ transport